MYIPTSSVCASYLLLTVTRLRQARAREGGQAPDAVHPRAGGQVALHRRRLGPPAGNVPSYLLLTASYFLLNVTPLHRRRLGPPATRQGPVQTHDVATTVNCRMAAIVFTACALR